MKAGTVVSFSRRATAVARATAAGSSDFQVARRLARLFATMIESESRA